LAHTHGADYEVDDLPSEVTTFVEENLKTFLQGKTNEMMNDGSSSFGKRKHRSNKGDSKNDVSWGFKAPVSLLLTPYLLKLTGGLKVLHVVSITTRR